MPWVMPTPTAAIPTSVLWIANSQIERGIDRVTTRSAPMATIPVAPSSTNCVVVIGRPSRSEP